MDILSDDVPKQILMETLRELQFAEQNGYWLPPAEALRRERENAKAERLIRDPSTQAVHATDDLEFYTPRYIATDNVESTVSPQRALEQRERAECEAMLLVAGYGLPVCPGLLDDIVQIIINDAY